MHQVVSGKAFWKLGRGRILNVTYSPETARAPSIMVVYRITSGWRSIQDIIKKFLRSPYIDYWECYNIQKVRLELNTRGKTVAFIEFNGRGSNYMNWFHNSRILRTSWTDMHKSGRYNYFSIDKETRFGRKFFINHSYPSGGCPRDVGWFVVAERKGGKPCTWEKYTTYPQFLYSKRGKMGRWVDKSSTGKAEVLNIYVQRK